MGISVDTQTTLVNPLGLRILQIANLYHRPNDDFFNAGMNALHVLDLTAVIRRSLAEAKTQADQNEITPKLIYVFTKIQASTSFLQ